MTMLSARYRGARRRARRTRRAWPARAGGYARLAGSHQLCARCWRDRAYGRSLAIWRGLRGLLRGNKEVMPGDARDNGRTRLLVNVPRPGSAPERLPAADEAAPGPGHPDAWQETAQREGRALHGLNHAQDVPRPGIVGDASLSPGTGPGHPFHALCCDEIPAQALHSHVHSPDCASALCHGCVPRPETGTGDRAGPERGPGHPQLSDGDARCRPCHLIWQAGSEPGAIIRTAQVRGVYLPLTEPYDASDDTITDWAPRLCARREPRAGILAGPDSLDALTCDDITDDSRNHRSGAWPAGYLLDPARPLPGWVRDILGADDVTGAMVAIAAGAR